MEDLIKGPLHTRAKSHNRKIVRAQKKCAKAVPRHFQNHVMWSRVLKCSAESYVIRPSSKYYFNEILFIQGPHT